MIGEALAMVMGNTRVWSAGIYFDQNQFPNRTYFAPYAYKTQLNTRRFQVGFKKQFFYWATGRQFSVIIKRAGPKKGSQKDF